jgi:uncharacterized membrane protein
MMLLDGRAKPGVARVRRALSRKPVIDNVVEGAAEAALTRLTPHAGAIHLSAEHGCVVLTGDVLTSERARVVREVAGVEGVDSVVDLMTEHRRDDGIAALATKGPRLASVARAHPAVVTPVPPTLRIAATGIGLGLIIASVRLRGWLAAAAATGGGLLLAGGVTGGARSGAGRIADMMRIRRKIDVDEEIIVRAPVEDIFAMFRALDNAPRFLRHVRAVERRGARNYRWSMDGADGAPLSWDTEVTTLLYNRRIGWRSVAGARVRTMGDVRFERLAPDATRVLVHLSYALPFGRDGRAVRDAFGGDPSGQVAEDLSRLEEMVEEGGPASYSPLSA